MHKTSTNLKIPPITIVAYMIIGATIGGLLKSQYGLDILDHEGQESFLVTFNLILFGTLILLGSISGPGAKPTVWKRTTGRYLYWTFLGTFLRYLVIGTVMLVVYLVTGSIEIALAVAMAYLIGAKLAASDPLANFIRSVLNSLQGKEETDEESVSDNESGSNDGLVLPLTYVTELGVREGIVAVVHSFIPTIGGILILAAVALVVKWLFRKSSFGQVLAALLIAIVGGYGSQYVEHTLHGFGALAAWLAGYLISLKGGEENDHAYHVHHVFKMEFAKLLTGGIILMVFMGLDFGRGFLHVLSLWLVIGAFLSRLILAIPEQKVLEWRGIQKFSWRQAISISAVGTTGLAVAYQQFIVTTIAGDVFTADIIQGFIVKSLVFIPVALLAMIGEN